MCLHAEESAIIEAGRPRTLGATLYTTHFPCQLCTRKIIQGGIIRVVYDKTYESALSREMLAMTDIEVVQLDPDTGVATVIKRSHISSFASPQKQQRQQSDLEPV